MSLEKRLKRQSMILAVANEMRQDSSDGQGINPANYERDDLFDCIENCVGFRLSDIETRLAVVVFEQGADVGKKSVWYTMATKCPRDKRAEKISGTVMAGKQKTKLIRNLLPLGISSKFQMLWEVHDGPGE